MLEVIVLACTAIAFLAIVAAVPIELGEERQDEHDATHRAAGGGAGR